MLVKRNNSAVVFGLYKCCLSLGFKDWLVCSKYRIAQLLKVRRYMEIVVLQVSRLVICLVKNNLLICEEVIMR